MVPGQVTVIPQFIIFKSLGLYGTQAPLYLPSFLGGAFGTFLMRQYFLTIPIELAEAARIDGASLAGSSSRSICRCPSPRWRRLRSLPFCFRGTTCFRR